MKQLPQDKNVDTSGEIVRAATEADEELIYTTEQLSQQACTKIRQIVADCGIDMKVTNAAYNLNQSQLFVSFTSENRVDFRALLKELAATFRTRIELRQIGARDAAKCMAVLVLVDDRFVVRSLFTNFRMSLLRWQKSVALFKTK